MHIFAYVLLQDMVIQPINQPTNQPTNSVALVRERTILTERPPFIGEVTANV
jgi:hypothetical protein